MVMKIYPFKSIIFLLIKCKCDHNGEISKKRVLDTKHQNFQNPVMLSRFLFVHS